MTRNIRTFVPLIALAISCAAPRAQVSPVRLPTKGIFGSYVSVPSSGGGGGLTDAQLRATPVPVSGTVSIAANQSVNVAQMNGVATTMGNGIAGTGVQRVAIASDNTAFSVNATPVGTTTVSGTVAATQSGTWTVQPGNTANTTAWKVDGSAVTQPVSGTVSANATQTGTWTVQPGNTANTTAWKVDGSAVTQPISAASLPLPTGAATSANQTTLGSHTTKVNDGTNTAAVKAASTAAAATDPALVVAVSPNNSVAVTQATAANLNAAIVGTKTNNNAAPGATNVGALPALANAAAPAWTEGNLVAGSVDLAGNMRTRERQIATYSAGTTAKTATAAGTGVFFGICGSGTKTIRVQYFGVSYTVATTAVYGDVVLKKTSTANSAGTATTLTQVPHDSNSAAGTATLVNFYTVLATTGTVVGVIRAMQQANAPVTATVGTIIPMQEATWAARTESEAIVLRGTSQCIAASFGTTTTNAPTMTVSVTWTEE